MSIANDIKSFNAAAQKVHGADISIIVARAVAWGSADNLLLIYGENHARAALDIASVAGKDAKITEEQSKFMDIQHHYSKVAF